MFYSLVICAAMHFYGYEGPEERNGVILDGISWNLLLPGFKIMIQMCGKLWTNKSTIKYHKRM